MEHNKNKIFSEALHRRCLEGATLLGARRMKAPSTAFTRLSSPKTASRRRSIWLLTSLQAGSDLFIAV